MINIKFKGKTHMMVESGAGAVLLEDDGESTRATFLFSKATTTNRGWYCSYYAHSEDRNSGLLKMVLNTLKQEFPRGPTMAIANL